MSPFTFFRQLYSLDTLDTRLTTSATTPLDVAQKERDTANHKGQNGKIENDVSVRAQPSKWNTPEFYFYALVFILVVPQMFKSVIDASKGSSGISLRRIVTKRLQNLILPISNTRICFRRDGYSVAKL